MSTTNNSNQKCQLQRPHYRPRQHLTSDQLNQDQAFQLQSLQRALHGLAGTGVVYGYSLTIEKNCIDISCGLAFDCYGRQLFWSGGIIKFDDLVADPPICAGKYTLCVHYAERYRVGSSQSTDCNSCEPDNDNVQWVDQCVVFTLKKGCTEKQLDCQSWNGCPDINHYVCKKLAKQTCYESPDKLTQRHCDDLFYDECQGIPLACIEICDLSDQSKQCDPYYGFCDTDPSICDYRPFVYRNELLYQLIRGDHLNYTRVESLSWQEWVRYNKEWEEQVSWADFIKQVKKSNGFEICFSQPVEINTIHPGSIILSAVTQKSHTDYWESCRIPLCVDPIDKNGNCARKFKLTFDADWCHCEIMDKRSTLEYGVTIELTIRGSLIRDKCGCMLDAQPLGYEHEEHHCCQPRPGGDFIALFRVSPKDKEADSTPKTPDKSEPAQQNSAKK